MSSFAGIYDGSEPTGWVTYENEGVWTYRLHSYRHDAREPEVSFGGNKKGSLSMGIWSSQQPLPGKIHATDDILVCSKDGSILRRYRLERNCTLAVPADEEFSIVVPAFKVGSYELPKLKVDFHWSGRRIYRTQHIFGS